MSKKDEDNTLSIMGVNAINPTHGLQLNQLTGTKTPTNQPKIQPKNQPKIMQKSNSEVFKIKKRENSNFRNYNEMLTMPKIENKAYDYDIEKAKA